MALSPFVYLDCNYCKVTIGHRGNIFGMQVPSLVPSFNIPKSSNTHTTYRCGIWISAKDSAGNVYAAAMSNPWRGFDFHSGRLLMTKQETAQIFIHFLGSVKYK